jgi:LytS/YehU family sensor histidine kinase
LKNDTEMASDYLTKFSRLIRLVLNNSKQFLISLEDELEMLRLYLELEKQRFKNSFNFNIILAKEIDPSALYIPPLLLQPFAENAIWHGLLHKEDKGVLDIELWLDNDMLNCSVTDNGIGRRMSEQLKIQSVRKQKSLGMQITKERLALLNRNLEHASVRIEDVTAENGKIAGTRVVLHIHYQTSADSHVEFPDVETKREAHGESNHS